MDNIKEEIELIKTGALTLTSSKEEAISYYLKSLREILDEGGMTKEMFQEVLNKAIEGLE